MEPITRSEQYLASILGEDVVLPIPQSRIEYYLNAIAQNGIAPSSAGLINYDPDANYPDGSIGKEMHTLDGDVDQLKSQISEVEASFPQKSASGSIVTIDDGADNVPVVSLVAQIVPVQSGSGDSSPDNVRPISGFTEVDVSVTGVNVWDEVWESGSITVDDGNVPDATRIRSKNYISVIPEKTYYIASGTENVVFIGYDSNKQGIHFVWGGYDTTPRRNNTLTIPSNVYYVRFYTSQTTYHNDISINYPSTDHEYHAYNGNVYPISLGQTVYGGTVTVANGQASAVSKYGYHVLTESNIELAPEAATYTHMAPVTLKNLPNQISSLTKWGLSEAAGEAVTVWPFDAESSVGKLIKNAGYNVFWVGFPCGTTLEQAKAALVGTGIAYELSSPVEIDLDPVQIKTLYGLNNIWASSGDIELTYRCDPATFTAEQIRLMLNAMVAPVEATTTASKAYSVNDFLIMDNVLYKVIANIASGGTITINTNVSATTIGEQITAILNS